MRFGFARMDEGGSRQSESPYREEVSCDNAAAGQLAFFLFAFFLVLISTLTFSCPAQARFLFTHSGEDPWITRLREAVVATAVRALRLVMAKKADRSEPRGAQTRAPFDRSQDMSRGGAAVSPIE